MTPDRRGAIARRCLAFTAGAAACFYVGWNVWWLSAGRLPPSILQWTTGVPVPSTGFTRSALAALRGDVASSLSWNPFLVPFCVLLAASAFFVVRRAARRERIVLPPRLARAWFVVLPLAWIVKLVQGPAWW